MTTTPTKGPKGSPIDLSKSPNPFLNGTFTQTQKKVDSLILSNFLNLYPEYFQNYLKNNIKDEKKIKDYTNFSPLNSFFANPTNAQKGELLLKKFSLDEICSLLITKANDKNAGNILSIGKNTLILSIIENATSIKELDEIDNHTFFSPFIKSGKADKMLFLKNLCKSNQEMLDIFDNIQSRNFFLQTKISILDEFGRILENNSQTFIKITNLKNIDYLTRSIQETIVFRLLGFCQTSVDIETLCSHKDELAQIGNLSNKTNITILDFCKNKISNIFVFYGNKTVLNSIKTTDIRLLEEFFGVCGTLENVLYCFQNEYIRRLLLENYSPARSQELDGRIIHELKHMRT